MNASLYWSGIYNDKAQEQPVSSLSPQYSWIGNCCFENGNYHSSQPPHWLWHWPCQGPGPTVSALSSPHYLQPLTLRGNYSDMTSIFLYIRVETLSPVYLVRDIHCSVVACAQDDMTTYSPLTTLHSARCTLQVTAGCDWAGWHSLDSSLTRVFTSDYI